MLSYFDLRKGVQFILEGEPYEVLEFQQMRKAQDMVVAQTKIKNLLTGKVFDRNFHKSDVFEEMEMEKTEVKFVYQRKGKFVFSESKNPANRLPERQRRVEMKANSEGGKLHRFELTEEQIGTGARFLKSNQTLTAIKFKEKIVNIVLPIKVQLKVTESPPGMRGGRAQAGNKTVVLETGAQINAPLFVEEGDMLEINTETGEYVRRVE